MSLLTDKQELFCEEYLKDLNATQAAIRAGYSVESARQIGSENLSKPDIQEYLKARRRELQEQLGIDQTRILKEYARLAFLDPRKFYTVDGALKPVKDLDEDEAAALAGMDVYEQRQDSDDENEQIVTGATKKIKTYDKVKALDSLARHLGMFTDKIDLTTGGEPLRGFQYVIPEDNSKSKTTHGLGETEG